VIAVIVVVVSAARVVVPIMTVPVCRPKVIAVLLNGPVRMPTGVDTAINRRGVIRKPWPRVSGPRRLIRHHIPLVSCWSMVEAL